MTQLEAAEEVIQQIKTFKIDNQRKYSNSDTEHSFQSPQKKARIHTNPLLSPAPPQIMTELHRTRSSLSDVQRQFRMQSRKVEELETQLQSSKPNLQLLKTCQDKIILLERENKEMRKECAMNEALDIQWTHFRHDIDGLFESTTPSNDINVHVVPNNDIDDRNMENTKDKKKYPPEIATIVRQFGSLREKLKRSQDQQSKTQVMMIASKQRIAHLESNLQEEEATVDTLQRQKDQLDEKLISSAIETRKCQAQESICKQEAYELRSILETFELKPEKPSAENKRKSDRPSEASSQGLQLSLSLSQDKLQALSDSYDELKKEINTILEEKKTLQHELDRVKEKFGKLREALMKEKEKCENAEERAVEAEKMAGKGSYDEKIKRVLHLQDNPFTRALHEKYKKEVEILKTEIEALKFVNSPSGKSETSKSSTNNSLSSSMSTLDAQKLHQRLKESFKEQISLFREGVYLLTGYKVDMDADNDKPIFTVRSMYSEKEDDHLIFMWPQTISDGKRQAVTSLDLLDSSLAQELSVTEGFKYMTKFMSIPAFMGSLTLSLFEKQTFMG